MALTRHFLNIPAVYKLGTRWAGYLPAPLTYAISQGVADLSYMLYKPAVKNIKGNLSAALPSLTDKEISRLTKSLFRNYGKYLVDYGRFTSLEKHSVLKKIVQFDGKEHLEAALKMNKGVILLTAHLGNWELGGIFFSSYGIKINVVTLMDHDAEIDYMRRWYREKHNVNTITLGSPFSAIEMLKALNEGEMVAMLIDRYDEGPDTVKVNFFNKPYDFPKGPFILSRAAEAPIIVAFVVREGDNYKGIVEKPLLIADEKGERDALEKTVKIIERYIMMYPDQWYNFRPV
ncbi:MAG: lysophospholipid acyltransferase family protein [Nitrospirae bacterium]|nr:lysophospholipid acyltransferase family protein [Nitrospirota bacterium]